MTPRTSILYRETLRLGPLANQELSELLGLSPAGITQMLKPLLVSRILLALAPDRFDPDRLQSTEKLEPSLQVPGLKPKRRKTTFTPNPQFGFLLACQFNQRTLMITKLGFDLTIEDEWIIQLPQTQPQSLTETLVQEISKTTTALQAQDHRPLLGLGLAVAGRIDQSTNRILYSQNIPEIAGMDLAGPLERRLTIPVILVNDAHAICLGERIFGEANQMDHFLTLFIDQGVGLGIMINGSPYQGFDQLAGEPGQLILEPQGKAKPGFVDGSFEAYVSQSALWDQLVPFHKNVEPQKSYEPHQAYDLLLDLHNHQPNQVDSLITSLASSLGLLCTNLFLLLSPQLISISGPLTALKDPLLKKIQGSIAHYAPEVVKATLTDRVSLGQAWEHKMAQGAGLVAAQKFLDMKDNNEVG